jgi:plasmid stabilization system protein ParE
MKVLVSRRAEDDLACIYTRLLEEVGPDFAERFLVAAETALVELGRHPQIGPHPGWVTRHQELRFWLISRTNYIIFYESNRAGVSIERVQDGRRDVHR